MPQLPVPGEEVPAVLAVRGDTLGHPADELHHQREVVLVTVVVLAAPGVEEKVTGGELEGHARQGPYIRRCGVLGAQYNLRAPVLPGLDILGELLVRPARVAEVHDDSLHRVDVLGGGRRAPSFLFVTGSLLLLLPIRRHVLRVLPGLLRVTVGLGSLLSLLLSLLLLVLGEFFAVVAVVLRGVEVNSRELRSHRRLTRNLSRYTRNLSRGAVLSPAVRRGVDVHRANLRLRLRLGFGQRRGQEDVLGLEIGVYDLLAAVKVVQTAQHVPAYSLDRAHGNPAVVVPLDERQEVIAEHLEAHAHVRAVRALVLERVHQLDHLAGAGVHVQSGRRSLFSLAFSLLSLRLSLLPVLALARLALAAVRRRSLAVVHLVHRRDLVQYGDLVASRLGVMARGFLNLERHLGVRARVVADPHRGEVAPSELLADDVPAVLVGVADGYRVVAALAVALGALVLGLGR